MLLLLLILLAGWREGAITEQGKLMQSAFTQVEHYVFLFLRLPLPLPLPLLVYL